MPEQHDRPGLPDPPINDEELTAQALAADLYAVVPFDAVPFRTLVGADDAAGGELLPDWYMPAPGSASGGGRGRHLSRYPRWQRRMAYVLIAAFLAIDAAGLCSTYGWITLA